MLTDYARNAKGTVLCFCTRIWRIPYCPRKLLKIVCQKLSPLLTSLIIIGKMNVLKVRGMPLEHAKVAEDDTFQQIVKACWEVRAFDLQKASRWIRCLLRLAMANNSLQTAEQMFRQILSLVGGACVVTTSQF